MEKFNPGLAGRPTLLVFTKMDLTGARENAKRALAEIGHPAGDVHRVSAVTGEGIASLLDGLLALRRRHPHVA